MSPQRAHPWVALLRDLEPGERARLREDDRLAGGVPCCVVLLSSSSLREREAVLDRNAEGRQRGCLGPGLAVIQCRNRQLCSELERRDVRNRNDPGGITHDLDQLG